MATAADVPLSEYLESSYRPDRDWIDGEVRERNMGEGPHSVIQKFLTMFLGLRESEWKILVLPEQRVQTSETHYRIPDLCVARSSAPFERVVRTPPLLCIEILSKDDRMTEMQERVDDYLEMGVAMVWIIDPRRRRAYGTDGRGAMERVEETLGVPGTEVRVAVLSVFEQLNQLEGAAQDS